jgi:hypothetical protein
MPPRGSAYVGAVSAAAFFVCGCSGSNAPKTGKGDTLKVDVPATNLPPQPPPDAGSTDALYGAVGEGGAYGYSPVTVCRDCACEAGTYCFGGGTGYTTFSGTCTGAPGLAVGCQPLPAGCGNPPTCDCIFQALKPEISCYPECLHNSALTVYCPSP